MARYGAERNFEPILAAARSWASRCLEDDGSLLVDGRALWTEENALVLRRDFVERPDLGSGTFQGKLRAQLAGSGPAATQLAAEMIWALLLFQSNITPRRKRENVSEVWSWSGEALPSSPDLADAVLVGIGSTGQGFNTYRWKELALLIDLTISIKRMPAAERRELLSQPWNFGEWLQLHPKDGYRQLPNLLRYLLFPDDYEHVTVADQKRMILRATISSSIVPYGNSANAAPRSGATTSSISMTTSTRAGGVPLRPLPGC